MKHLLTIDDLNAQDIAHLIQLAQSLQSNPEQYTSMANSAPLGLLFYENSTRTKLSFELAAKRLGFEVSSLDINTSSVQKGESVLDTLLNLKAMGIRFFIIRHRQEHIAQQMADAISDIHVINAGDGMHAHPTQALLDALTLYQVKGAFEPLKIAIIGDILHSRVANSLIACLSKMGTHDIRLIAPKAWQPTHSNLYVSDDINALEDVDVVYTLRVQKERIEDAELRSLEDYISRFQLTKQRLSKANPNAIVMHPGPMNRGIEIESDVADGAQSHILNQVNNGIWMRQAILYNIATNSKAAA